MRSVLPIVLDIANRRIAVVGRGYAALQRYEYVRDAGVEQISLYVIDQDGWACNAEAAIYERLPVKADLEGAAVVLIAGLVVEEATRIAASARAAGALVNVEDVPHLCDFHVPAIVRRGDLLLTVSTGGKAPGLAQKLKVHLQTQFGSEWTARIRTVADARARWREEGRAKAEITRLTNELVDREGWLKAREPA
ncbi:MAG: siroheme synthase [Alphaproteobacteria bacterium]|nr:siroheme synthase [Alphaproteobacteria bacterium]